MKLLLINSLKGLKKKKIQMLGIIFMVLLSTAIYTAMNSAVDRVEYEYYNYLNKHNVEHFSIDINIDYQKDISLMKLDEYKNNELKNVTNEENQIITAYTYCLSGIPNTCDPNVFLGVEQVFKKYGIYQTLGQEKLDELKIKYDFNYELERTKIGTSENYTYNVLPYEANTTINKPYLVEGSFPTRAGEVTVLPNFAASNNLEIGDNITILEEEYKIVGYAYASDYIYPLLSMNQPIFDEKYNNIVFMLESDYSLFKGFNNDTYSIYLNGEFSRENRINFLEPSNNEDYNFEKELNEARNNKDSMAVFSLLLKEDSDKVKSSVNTFIRIIRTDMIQNEFDTNRTFALAFLYLLLSVAVIVILVITKKRIDDERLQIGVLKSLGYKKYQIATSYLVYPVIGSIIGGIIGYIIGILLHYPLTNLYVSYFTLPINEFVFNTEYLINSVIIPTIVLSLLSFIISYIMLRKKPLDLLREGSNLKVNLLSKFTNKITSFMKFESRFRYQLAARSIGKLLIVTLTSFCTGLLLTLIMIGSNLFTSMIDNMFDAMKFDYIVSYSVMNEDYNEEDDFAITGSYDVEKITDKNDQEKELEDDNYSISLSGIDSSLKYIEIKDKNDIDLIDDLFINDNSIIINSTTSEYLDVEVGDNIIFNINNTNISYEVIGIDNQYLQPSAYVTRESLSNVMGYENLVYNTKYTTNNNYKNLDKLETKEVENISSIFTVNELKTNIEKQIEVMNIMIYIIIFFASFMVFIIVAVIANIVVEENKKTISLMKVMGYNNKEISKVVLKIYTPFIVIAYLLSIPVMIHILKYILSIILVDTAMVIPISLSPFMAITGLIGLLVAYYIAVNISKRLLNKVPLAIALKRE